MNCPGQAQDKARIFYMVVQPQMDQRLAYNDVDLKKAVTYLIQYAAIFQQLKHEIGEKRKEFE